jgi:hypothetical protein
MLLDVAVLDGIEGLGELLDVTPSQDATELLLRFSMSRLTQRTTIEPPCQRFTFFE